MTDINETKPVSMNFTLVERVPKRQRFINALALAAFIGFVIDHVTIKIEKKNKEKEKEEAKTEE